MSDILFGLACLAIGAAFGGVVGFRRGQSRTWLMAALSVVWATRAMAVQLTRAERALADLGEAEHAAIRDPHGWGNGAGYRSTRLSPADREVRHVAQAR